jgi:nucleotide-binding universal stress UspA family protein
MPDILITTNGFKGTWPSIEYGIWLAGILEAKVTLLGVDEKSGHAPSEGHPVLDETLAQAVELFKGKGIDYTIETREGNAEDVIPQQANTGNFITVVGPLGRPQLRRWLVGRSIRHFMEAIKGPILYVPRLRLPLNKTLICVGGLGYEVAAENLAFRVALKSHSQVTLLHVVAPMNLDYPASRAVHENWNHLVDTNTLPGRSLRSALEIAQSMGVDASVIVRQGKVEEEILDEVQRGDYDLICMGSPYSASLMRQLYAPNVTANIAEAADCPMLTARHKP